MEQYMMYQKAICFGDTKIAEKILETTDVAIGVEISTAWAKGLSFDENI